MIQGIDVDVLVPDHARHSGERERSTSCVMTCPPNCVAAANAPTSDRVFLHPRQLTSTEPGRCRDEENQSF